MTTDKARNAVYSTEIILGQVKPPVVAGMGIGNICSSFSLTLAETSIVSLADALEDKPGVQAIGVVDKQGKALGIITRQNLFGILSRPFGRDVLRKKRAANFLSETERFNVNENIFTVSDTVEEKINSNENHYFLIVNDNDEFCGIFSGKDMLVFLAEITRQDIALSRKIQTRIVKEEDDFQGGNFTAAASSVMAKGIGGDFYSYKEIADGLYLIVICDVSGKGMAASLLSSVLSGFINTYSIGLDLPGFVSDLNRQLTQSFEGEKFVTGIFALFNEETGQVQIADMGHRHYVLFSNGKAVELNNAVTNIPLGVSADLQVQTFNIGLKKYDCLLLMTDGILEQKNTKGQIYHKEKIHGVFGEHGELSAGELRTRLNADFNAFRGNAARQDDISFLILKYLPGTAGKSDGCFTGKKNTTEDKIKWALTTGKPIQIRTNRYTSVDRDFIDTVLDRFLNEAGIKFLMNKVSYCVHELATNAKKANTKRVYFQTKGLDIGNKKHYAMGMKDFKRETIENIDYYLNLQNKLGFFIVIMFQLTKTELKISVVNNSEMTFEEKTRVKYKLKMAGSQTAIGDIYDQIEDYSEGAGLGIVMMSQMLRTMGLGTEVLSIESEQGLTTAQLRIMLREEKAAV